MIKIINDNFNDLAKDYYKLQENCKKLEELVELLYYKIELNDEQQELLDNILIGGSE